MDEVEEWVRLPEKQHVASQAVSFHCNREQTAAVVREGKPVITGQTGSDFTGPDGRGEERRDKTTD